MHLEKGTSLDKFVIPHLERKLLGQTAEKRDRDRGNLRKVMEGYKKRMSGGKVKKKVKTESGENGGNADGRNEKKKWQKRMDSRMLERRKGKDSGRERTEAMRPAE